MKKLLSIVVALTFMLGLIGCSNKEKIPSINEVSQMKYSEVNAALTGKDIQVIRDGWGGNRLRVMAKKMYGCLMKVCCL